MSNATAWWNRLWFTEIAPDIFALLRILLGVLGLASLVGLLDLALFWSCNGIVTARNSVLCGQFVSMGLGWLPGSAALAFAVLSFAAMAAGFYTRFAVLCSFASISVMALWNDLPLSSAHQVLRSLLFCLVWADSGLVWSIDAWRSRGGSPARGTTPVPIWPLRLMRVQIAAIYFITGLWKLNNVVWRDGTAVHHVFGNVQFRRFEFLSSTSLDTWTTLATYATLAWELGFAFLVLHPRTRALALVSGIAIHLGMWAGLELGPFSWIMIASYAAFLDPESVSRWRRAWDGRERTTLSARAPTDDARPAKVDAAQTR